MIMNGYFISLEGIEGAGKSTHAKWMTQFLESRSHKVCMTREPGGTFYAEKIRNILIQPSDEPLEPISEAMLMFAARCEHVSKVIKPALSQGEVVISDRFVDASMAYQGGGRGVHDDALEQLSKIALQGIKPDLTILFDLKVDVACERVKMRDHLDRFEREPQAFFEKVRKAYLDLAKQHTERFFIIDAEKSIDEIQYDLAQLLSERMSF